jgi:hypothetical protein
MLDRAACPGYPLPGRAALIVPHRLTTGAKSVTTEFDLLEALAKTVEAHGISAAISENLVVLPSSGLAFSVHVHPHSSHGDTTMIQLDVGTAAPLLAGRTAWQSFAGLGASRPLAERDAFAKFIMCSFHALLSALGNHQDPETEWLEWRGPSGSWKVCTSPLLVHGGDPSSMGYSTFVDTLHALFASDVSPGIHWCEVFFASVDGNLAAAEVRLDNSPWPRASEALASWHVAPQQGYRSGRHFFVALPS